MVLCPSILGLSFLLHRLAAFVSITATLLRLTKAGAAGSPINRGAAIFGDMYV